MTARVNSASWWHRTQEHSNFRPRKGWFFLIITVRKSPSHKRHLKLLSYNRWLNHYTVTSSYFSIMIHDNVLYLFLGMKARGAGGVTLHISHLHQPVTFVFLIWRKDILYRKFQGPAPYLSAKGPLLHICFPSTKCTRCGFVVNIGHMCGTENSSKNLLRLKYWWKRDGPWIFLYKRPSSRVSIVSQFFSKKDNLKLRKDFLANFIIRNLSEYSTNKIQERWILFKQQKIVLMLLFLVQYLKENFASLCM